MVPDYGCFKCILKTTRICSEDNHVRGDNELRLSVCVCIVIVGSGSQCASTNRRRILECPRKNRFDELTKAGLHNNRGPTTSTSLCHVPPSVAAPHGLHLLAAAASPGSRRDVVAPHPCSLYYSSHRRASPCHGVRASNRDPTTTRDLPHLPPARHQHSGPHFRAMAETPEAVAARYCQDRGPVIDHS